MLITKRNQYALRAIFELAKHNGKGPQKISEIAQAQAIPVKFLEVILNQLKGSGLVESKRGFYGGYFLVRQPSKIAVGDIMRFMERNHEQSQCVALVPEINCPFKGDCAFYPMWNQVKDAIYKVYDGTSIQDLIDTEKQVENCQL
jgi:Rrf2 family protein